MTEPQRMRLDKWLWAARFFKTRKLAAEAVQGGHVHLNGQRTKPGKEVRVGSRLYINRNGLEWAIEVLELPKQRRPAREAATFFREEESSRLRREEVLAMRRAERAATPLRTEGRPNKRERRLIHRFKQGS